MDDGRSLAFAGLMYVVGLATAPWIWAWWWGLGPVKRRGRGHCCGAGYCPRDDGGR